MSPTVTVRYVANGYIIVSQGQPAGIAAEIYAATLPEVVFWIDQIFSPPPP